MNAIIPLMASDEIGHMAAHSLLKPAPGQRISATVVSSLDERQMVTAIRAAVFLGEEGGLYSQHFDENDIDAAFVLVRFGSEPVGTVRIRYFADFIRLDKLAVLKAYRVFPVLNALITAAFRYARAKGYGTVTGIARPGTEKFWKRRKCRETGVPVLTKYGPLLPMSGPIPDYPDIEPIRLDDCGAEDFEIRLFGWEGNRI